ncbi:hypothetical protein [Rhodococcus jostii]|uniref:hypothetical protein n=1 Tax=Rhodococcus jostii TaxID=132919 RepID=UPI0036261CB8
MVGILGIIIAFATPLYVELPFDQWVDGGQSSQLLSGYNWLKHPTLAAIYWVVALPLGYALIAVYLISRGAARGVRINMTGILTVGVVLTAALVVVTLCAPAVFQRFVPWYLAGRGLLPLLIVSLALLVWAVMLRQLSVLAVGCAAVAASLVSILYNVANPLLAAGIQIPIEYRLMVNVALTAVVLLLGAAALAWKERG